jgi:hypothetical protein
MARQLRLIASAMENILRDSKASRLDKTEASKILLATNGILLPSASDTALPSKLRLKLQMARSTVAERLFQQRERKGIRNKRAYLKRTLQGQELEAALVTLDSPQDVGKNERQEPERLTEVQAALRRVLGE